MFENATSNQASIDRCPDELRDEVHSHPIFGFNVLALKIGAIAATAIAVAILLLVRTPGSPLLALCVFLLAPVFVLTRQFIIRRVRTYGHLDAAVAFYHIVILGPVVLAPSVDTQNQTSAGVCCFLIVFSFLYVSHKLFVVTTLLGSTLWMLSMRYHGGQPSNLDTISLFVTGPLTASVARFAVLGSTRDLLNSRAAEKKTVLSLQESLRQLNVETELRKASERQLLQAQKNQSLGQMATGVAHDFNNLLLAISVYAESIQAISKDPTVQEHSTHIVSATGQASDICRSMLTYAGKSNDRMKLLSLSKLAKDTLPLLRVAVAPSIDLQIQDSDSTQLVLANETQLQQVLMNLVTNAAHACADSEAITISVSDHRIDSRNINAMPEIVCGAPLEPGLYKQLAVKDVGHGIPDHVKSQMFDPYFTTRESGHGLGLSLVLGIVSSHSGTLCMDSSETTGTTATLLLPAHAAPRDKADGTAPSSPARMTNPGQTILVVEDDELVRSALLSILRAIGWEATAAENGQSALRVLETQPDFDLLLIDFRMPDMNGHATLAKARSMGCTAPAILCSGHISAPEQDQVLAEFTGFLHKPFLRAELEELLCKLAPGNTDA